MFPKVVVLLVVMRAVLETLPLSALVREIAAACFPYRPVIPVVVE